MQVVDGVAAVVLAGCLLLLVLVARRWWIGRGGSVNVCIRCPHTRRGRHWILGLGRYDAERLLWFRVFSLAPRPRVAIARRELRVESRRPPTRHESIALKHDGLIILDCTTRSGPIELALAEAELPGFLAWLESAPPGVPVRR